MHLRQGGGYGRFRQRENEGSSCPRPATWNAWAQATTDGRIKPGQLLLLEAMGGGFTYGFSVGNQADLDLCDFVDFLIDDPKTQVICTYIEGIKDTQALRRTARRAQAHQALERLGAGAAHASRPVPAVARLQPSLEMIDETNAAQAFDRNCVV